MSGQKKIGVSGGIGSGKSFVCALLEKKGFPVYYADPRAKVLMEDNDEVHQQLVEAFGSETFKNNRLNKSYIASLIFNDDSKRESINNIVHPAVERDFIQWSANQQSTIVFQESALLFDTGAYLRFDATVLVIAPRDLRLRRIMDRDKCSEQDALARIQSQGNPELYRTLANYVIYNDEVQDLDSQIESIISSLYSTSS